MNPIPIRHVADAIQSQQAGIGALRYLYEDGCEPKAGTLAALDFPANVIAVVVRVPALVQDSETGEYAPWLNGIEVDWPIRPNKTSTGQSWELSGTYDKPTLSPSMFWPGGSFHGRLEAGLLYQG